MNLGPQQTRAAYEAAIAFGVDVLEVDLRLTRDGVFVVAHDERPAAVGVPAQERRAVAEMTAAEYVELNGALAPWTGTELDPAPYVTLDDVLALAAEHGTGLDIELTSLVLQRERIRAVAQAVEDAGVMDLSLWQHGADLDLVAMVPSVDPEAHVNVKLDAEHPPAFLYALAAGNEWSFGSRLDEFTPDKVAAIHDGCALALPHSYDGLDDRDVSAGETAREHAAMVDGLRLGLDGFQTNRPDAAASALGRPVPTRLDRRGKQVCLVNDENGLGLPGHVLELPGRAVTTGEGGCASVPGKAPVQFQGDGAALTARPLRPGPA